MARVAEPAVAIVIGELLRLHQQVDVIRAMVGAELERLDEVQHLEHGKALRRRRRLVNGYAAVSAGDRIAPIGALRGEVRAAEESAALSREARQRGGDLALIVAGTPLRGDRFERA